jgi:hypothetical protein
LGSILFSIVGKIHEGALVEFFNGDFSHPHEESLVLGVQETGVVSMEMRGIETYSAIEL